MKRKIDEIWQNLEVNQFSSHPLLMRGYSGQVKAEIYVALKFPERLRCIAIHLNADHSFTLNSWENFKDLKLDTLPDLKDPSRKYFLIVLLNEKLKEIFSALSEDLILSLSNTTNEAILVKEVLQRLEKWAALFSRAATEGLSGEEQRGLFGELFLLRKWLLNSPDKEKCLNAWVGPEQAIKDFQFGTWALEVKTTKGNNHQKVHISSERQLDNSNLSNLFLFHLSLEVQQGSGETLNYIVEAISEMLAEDFYLSSVFNLKLLQGGYFNNHKPLYEIKGYHIRQETFYEVRDDFPRIQENEVRNGVGDIKYSIIISNCDSYQTNEQAVYKVLN